MGELAGVLRPFLQSIWEYVFHALALYSVTGANGATTGLPYNSPRRVQGFARLIALAWPPGMVPATLKATLVFGLVPAPQGWLVACSEARALLHICPLAST